MVSSKLRIEDVGCDFLHAYIISSDFGASTGWEGMAFVCPLADIL